MKTLRYILLYLIMLVPACFLPASGETIEGKLSEDAQIDLLIKATQNSLEQLQILRTNLQNFRKQEALCIQSPDNAERLYDLSKAALELFEKIRETCLEPYFRTAFLEELEVIAKPAQKHTIPPIIQ